MRQLSYLARHCEERLGDEAIQGDRGNAGAALLDCFAARAARNDDISLTGRA
jgi:hypothetical protein